MEKSGSLAKRRQRQTVICAVVFLLPVLILLCTFLVYPIIQTFINSFTKWNGISVEKTFNGLTNWKKLIGDQNFWQAFLNNVKIIYMGVNNGEVNIGSNATNGDAGYEVAYDDFERTQEMDDIYTLSVEVYDMAGNHTEDSIMFSVNRFGSVYEFDTLLKELLEKFYVNHVDGDIIIKETNVDTLTDGYNKSRRQANRQADNFAQVLRYC